MKKPQVQAPAQNSSEPVRHVRLHLADHLYRTIRHRLADTPPGTSISTVISELVEIGLSVGR